LKNAQAAHFKERCELLLEQIDDCKKSGNTDNNSYRALQQAYINNSQAYIDIMDVQIKIKMRQLGVEKPKNAKPLTEDQLRGLGLSEPTISFLKGLDIGNQAG
jgi:hypothetical protein